MEAFTPYGGYVECAEAAESDGAVVLEPNSRGAAADAGHDVGACGCHVVARSWGGMGHDDVDLAREVR